MVDQKGEPWFVARDGCDVLGISNVSDAMARLDEDEKGVAQIDTLGGKQSVRIVSEPGLYSLILRSDKPEAKPFKRWVTHEVLPRIRKTGGYVLGEEHLESEEELTLRVMQMLHKKVEAQRAQIEEQAPKVAAFEHYMESPKGKAGHSNSLVALINPFS